LLKFIFVNYILYKEKVFYKYKIFHHHLHFMLVFHYKGYAKKKMDISRIIFAYVIMCSTF